MSSKYDKKKSRSLFGTSGASTNTFFVIIALLLVVCLKELYFSIVNEIALKKKSFLITITSKQSYSMNEKEITFLNFFFF